MLLSPPRPLGRSAVVLVAALLPPPPPGSEAGHLFRVRAMIARKFCRLRTRLFVRYIDLYACIYGIRISRIRYDFEVQVADSDMHGPWRLAMAARSPHNMVELDNRLLPRIRSELCTAVAVALARLHKTIIGVDESCIAARALTHNTQVKSPAQPRCGSRLTHPSRCDKSCLTQILVGTRWPGRSM